METELKFQLEPAAAKRVAEHLDLAARGKHRRLRSVYFDTPDGDLRRHGLTLRVRDDGRSRTQTVKRSGAGGIHRGEWETALAGEAVAGAPFDLKAAVKTPLGQVIDADTLARAQPVFEVDVERISRILKVGATTVEAALDRGEVKAAGCATPVHELELELKTGHTPALFRLAHELGEVAAIDLSFTSKSQRGFALLDDATAAGAEHPRLKSGCTSSEAFKTIAQAALAQIARNAQLLRDVDDPQPDPELVHQLRVGVRRLRTAVTLFEPMLADAQLAAAKNELKWLGHELDDARDLDVFIAGPLAKACKTQADLHGLAELERTLGAAHAASYKRVRRAIGSTRFRGLLLRLLTWVEAGDWALGEDPLLTALRNRPIEAVVTRIFEERRRKILKTGRKLEKLPPRARHKLRIKIKQLRYACEFFEDVCASRGRSAFLKTLRDLQDALGAMTDDAVSHALLARFTGLAPAKPHADPSTTFAAGALLGATHGQGPKRMKTALKAMRAARETPAFW